MGSLLLLQCENPGAVAQTAPGLSAPAAGIQGALHCSAGKGRAAAPPARMLQKLVYKTKTPRLREVLKTWRFYLRAHGPGTAHMAEKIAWRLFYIKCAFPTNVEKIGQNLI